MRSGDTIRALRRDAAGGWRAGDMLVVTHADDATVMFIDEDGDERHRLKEEFVVVTRARAFLARLAPWLLLAILAANAFALTTHIIHNTGPSWLVALQAIVVFLGMHEGDYRPLTNAIGRAVSWAYALGKRVS